MADSARTLLVKEPPMMPRGEGGLKGSETTRASGPGCLLAANQFENGCRQSRCNTTGTVTGKTNVDERGSHSGERAPLSRDRIIAPADRRLPSAPALVAAGPGRALGAHGNRRARGLFRGPRPLRC